MKADAEVAWQWKLELQKSTSSNQCDQPQLQSSNVTGSSTKANIIIETEPIEKTKQKPTQKKHTHTQFN